MSITLQKRQDLIDNSAPGNVNGGLGLTTKQHLLCIE